MKKGLGIFYVWYCLLQCFYLGGYAYDLKVLRKWYPNYNRYHYWVGVEDFHDKTHTANAPQRVKIEESLPCHNPKDLLVLVEDLSSVNDAGRVGCGPYYINSRVGILAGLGIFCRLNSIPVFNVEYRYCRVVGLGPVINNITTDPALFPSVQKVTIGQLAHEIDRVRTDLLLGNTKDAFKTLIQEKAREVTQEMKQLHLMQDYKKTVADYLKTNSTPLARLDLVQKLLTFDGIFIGLKFAHATMQKAPNTLKIIALGGGTHINEAYEILQKIDNWEPVIHAQSNNGPSSAISKSIGSSTDALNGSKPKPVSLELLEHYLKN